MLLNDSSMTPPEAPDRGLRLGGLCAVLAVAAGLRFWRLDRNGFGNPYYAAAVRSMLARPSNFFFGSFDPIGVVTVDKPPGAIWVQAISAKLLGFRGLSLLLPEALMGVASVWIVYHLARRVFGNAAGLLAGLMLAITPICVAVDRDNLPDPALVFTLLLASWALTLAAETGRLGWLLLCAATVGVGFNIKMLAAFVPLPTFYFCYFVAAPIRWRARLGHLAAATLVLVAVSLSWSIAVELTPKSQRPYIGGSKDNSALELALGYNGINRIFGGGGNLGPPGGPFPSGGHGPARSPGGPAGGFPPGGPFRGMPPGFGGPPGFLRFTTPFMAGQITWLVPIAVLGTAVAAARIRRQWPLAPGHLALLLWAGWLATHWVVFSFARGIFHEYYATILGPAVSAMAGIGTVALLDEWKEGRGRGYLPMALVLTAAWQSSIFAHYPSIREWALPALGVGTIAAVICLVGSRWLTARWGAVRWASLATGVGISSLLLGPAIWSASCVLAPGNPLMPGADPSKLTGRGPSSGMPMMPPPGMVGELNRKLVDFLRANRRDERILLAAPSSMEVSSIIIQAGEPAISFGGFMGADPAITREGFAKLVEQGQVRFVLLGAFPGPGGPGGPPGMGMLPPPGGMLFPPGGPGGRGNPELLDWIREHGKVVDPALWQEDMPAEVDAHDEAPGPPGGFPGGFPGMFHRMRRMAKLYDCNPSLGLITPGSAER